MGLPGPGAAWAAPQGSGLEARPYLIAGGKLSDVLAQFAAAAEVPLSFAPQQLAGLQSSGLQGRYTVVQGFAQLLEGSGYQAWDAGHGRYVLQALAVPPASVAQGAEATLATVQVRAQSERFAQPPPSYAGGQIARGARMGLLGNTDVMDSPFHISSYTAQAIEDAQATSIMAVIRDDPSVQSLFPAGALGEYFLVRGMHTQSHEMAWDGLYGLVPHNRTPVEFLERIEVLKGPGALLYGMSLGGAVGGVINLLPKRAGARPLTRLTTSYVSDSQWGGHLDLSRRFGADNAFGIRVNAVRAHGGLAIDGQEEGRTIGSAALDFVNERVRATLDIYSIEERQRGGSPLMSSFATAELPRPPDPSLNHLPGGYGHSRSKAAIAALDMDVSAHWQAYFKAGVKAQRGGGYLNNVFGANALPSGDFQGRSFAIANYFDVRSGEAGLRGRFTTGAIAHSLALSTTVVDQVSGALANLAPWPSNLYDPAPPMLAAEPERRKTGQTTLTSLAMADTLSFLNDRYLLTLGLRQQRVRTKAYAPAGAVSAAYDKSALTPALGFVAKPWAASVSLYMNYIQGLSEGGTVNDPAAANHGQVFSPYKSEQLEAGIKWDTGDLLSTLGVFQITRPSLLKDPSTNTYALDGRQRNRGLEWTLAGQAHAHLRLLGGITHLRAVSTRTLAGRFDGNDAMGVPRWSASLGAQWSPPWMHGLALTGSGVFSGSQYADNANTQRLPSWSRLDLGLRYATHWAGRPTVLRASVSNALDKRYWASVYSGYASVGAGRSYRLSMQVDF